MLMVWDELKRVINLDRHGLDLAAARDRFVIEQAVILLGHSGRGDRPRFVAVGPLDGCLVAVVFSPSGTEALS